MEFHTSTCFEHLVESNLLYLVGNLTESPSYYGALHEESDVILSELVEVGQKGVLTISSQPAKTSDVRRQRGYVQGAMLGDIDRFVKLLDETTNLEYVIVSKNVYLESVDKDNISEDKHRVWGLSQVRMGTVWDTCYGDCLVDDGRGIVEEFVPYATDAYDVTQDDEVVFFIVCDDVYGLPANSCCKELIGVLDAMGGEDNTDNDNVTV